MHCKLIVDQLQEAIIVYWQDGYRMKKKEKKQTCFLRAAMMVLTTILIVLFFAIMSMVGKIQGTKGSIKGTGFEFNGDGELSYTVTMFDGKEEVKTVSVPQNYRLEVEQLGRCVAGEETPAVTKEFSLANARIIDSILKEIGY